MINNKDYEEIKDINDFDDFDPNKWNEAKNHLFLRIFNKENLPNNRKLDEIPYIPFADLAITLSLEEKTYIGDMRTVNAYLVTNKDLEQYSNVEGLTTEFIFETAKLNMKEKNSPRIETFLQHQLRSNSFYPLTKIPDNLPYGLMSQDSKMPSQLGMSSPQNPPLPMIHNTNEDKKDVLILSNRTSTFGSVSMVFSDVLSEIYKRFGNENFYIIPASVHQSICVRKNFVTHADTFSEKETIQDLYDMLESINDNINNKETDILSYNIYCYYADECCTIIC